MFHPKSSSLRYYQEMIASCSPSPPFFKIKFLHSQVSACSMNHELFLGQLTCDHLLKSHICARQLLLCSLHQPAPGWPSPPTAGIKSGCCTVHHWELEWNSNLQSRALGILGTQQQKEKVTYLNSFPGKCSKSVGQVWKEQWERNGSTWLFEWDANCHSITN